MGLYEDYKRFKAGKNLTSIHRFKLNLFNLDFTEEQIMAISEYDFKSSILGALLIVGAFIFGIIYGTSQVL